MSKQQNTVLQTLAKINILGLKHHKEIIMWLIIFTACISAAPFLFSYVQGIFIDKIILYVADGGVGSLRSIYITLVIFMVVYLFQKLTNIVSDFVTRRFQVKMNTTSAHELLIKKSTLSVADYDNSEIWSGILKATESQNTIGATIHTQNQIIRLVITLVIGIVIIANFSVLSMVIIIVTSLPIALVSFLENNADWKRWLQETTMRKHINYVYSIFSSERSLAEVKFFQVAKKLISKWKTMQVEHVEKKIFQIQDHYMPYFVLATIVSIIGYMVVFYILLKQGVSGQLSIGKITFYISSIFSLGTTFSSLISQIGGNYQSVLKLKEYIDFMELAPSVKEEGITPEPMIHPPLISIKNLYFSYPEKDVLKNVSCVIKPGEKIAIVGLNGAGKTTLMKMITKVYHPSSGSIHIDEHLLDDVSTAWWYQHLGVLSQEYTNYSFTVEESIAVGSNTPLDSDLVIECAKLAQVHDTIIELPLGYKTQLGKQLKDGYNFSIGQWQKIAIARALYRKPKVLILDEPTSAVDAEAEEAIFNNLHDLSGDTSLIFVSHRFSTIRRADRILLVENGTIEEQGSHEQLMLKKGKYAYLFNLQAKSYQ